MKVGPKILITVLIAAATTAAICYLFLPELSQQSKAEALEVIVGSNVQQKDYSKILFVGDLIFDRGIRYYANKNGSNEFIFEKISPILLSNDIVVANLEGPITDNKSVSAGTTPGSANNYFFTFDPSVAQTLFEKNIRLVDLGNNHILNFGAEGLASTKDYLNKAGVDYFGASDNPKSISTEINGIKITFISYNEFSSFPGDTKEGATIEEIKKAKEYSDIIIVFSHWGIEYSLTPTDTMKDLAHQFIDEGADLIIGSHPHVIEPMEIYNGKRIYYSLGNFIFDQYFNEDVRNGLGVEVKIDKASKKLQFSEKKFYLEANGQTRLVGEAGN